MAKLLIIDKSSFHGTTSNELNDFVRRHNVLLPYMLMFECIISQREKKKEAKEPCKLLTRFIDCVKSGAKVGKSPTDILEEEKSKNAPIDSIIDEKETRIIRTSDLVENRIEQTAKICEETFKPTIAASLQSAKKAYEEICKMGMIRYSNEERLELLQAIDIDLEQQFALEGSFSNIKNDWWTWQMSRLIQVWVIELAFKSRMNIDGMNTSKISNDIHDIHYVACLLKADGLLTAEKKLQSLAKAAFPEKDVFCDIGEVPSGYM